MKRLLCIIALMFALVCMLTSCSDNEPTISVNDDGFVVVNGVTTNIVANKDDVITVDDDGYVIVNGTKTEHKIHTTDEISVNADGYVVVNGVTTGIIADKEDVVTADDDGFVIVNGTKTEYKIDQGSEGCTHNFDANGICNICNAANPNRIEYSLSLGTKIDALSISEQEMIDAYVTDCKTLYKVGYAPIAFDTRLNLASYLSFTDVLVYDFRNVDENTLDSQSLTLWNVLKTYYTESRPMMYVELTGYHACYNSYLLTPIQGGSIIYGFFIFEDETVICQTYNRLCSTHYMYKLIEGTEFINCGNKYAEDFNHEQFSSWVNSMSEYRSLQDMMQKLRIPE